MVTFRAAFYSGKIAALLVQQTTQITHLVIVLKSSVVDYCRFHCLNENHLDPEHKIFDTYSRLLFFN